MPNRVPWIALLTLIAAGSMAAQTTPVAAPAESTEALFARRIAGRADKILERLQPASPALAAEVRQAVLRFYRDLHAAHEAREAQLARLPAGDPPQIHRVIFEADKQSRQVHGELIGSLAPVLADRQIEAVTDWMTFDMVPLSVAEYQRMFPGMNARQQAQIRAWLVESREQAVIAGSAEKKLDVFRVNKMRMHAYLAAQGFDVETAIRVETARKAAEKTPE